MAVDAWCSYNSWATCGAVSARRSHIVSVASENVLTEQIELHQTRADAVDFSLRCEDIRKTTPYRVDSFLDELHRKAAICLSVRRRVHVN